MTDYSYQLYSSRKFGPLPDTLKMIAAAGYTQCEGYGDLFSKLGSLDNLKADLQANGLKMTTGHFSLDMVTGQSKRVIEIAKALEMKAVFVPSVPHDTRVRDPEGWAALGRTLASWIFKPPPTARSEDIRRLGFALGTWGGLTAFDALQETIGSRPDDPALQGALLGALLARTTE
jgi:sugar phosphate isomerase/epimerase